MAVVPSSLIFRLIRPALSVPFSRARQSRRLLGTFVPSTSSTPAIEEERLPHYNVEHFYPVQPKEIFEDRYQAIAKLGFGGGSTVWLARNLDSRFSKAESGEGDSEPYVVLKFGTCDYLHKEAARHELEVYRHLSISDPSHNGKQYIQTLVDKFEVAGPHGTHICLVFEPMRETLSAYQSRLKGARLPLELLKLYVVCLLDGLDCLHSRCRIVHADLKLENILVSFEDTSILEKFVQVHDERKMPRVDRGGHSIYQSQNQFGPLQVRLGPIVPIISDFGHAQWINESQPQINPIQPDNYRAPEVILGTGWGSSADIWNFGVLLWNMVEGTKKNLFGNIHSQEGTYMARNHLAQMIALLGPPPVKLLECERKMRTWNFAPAMENYENRACHKVYEFYGGSFFDDKGSFLYPELIPKELKFENTIATLENEEKSAFLDFVAGGMLRWDPVERKTAKELLTHPWLADVVLPWERV
ncbi:hypothetical protein QTJ16_006581 [Diplocarpon rosae]|uniref:non-specific serine/threonine protein kinase n=1 Tax=Diplocarpon rosae TaxID=946125 RepID=A0AAD9SVV6_9HELO|nr:hypothetical protein QTJ16_006581 [Diplocarpon rosae]